MAVSSSKTWGEKLHGAVTFKIPHPMELPLMGKNVETDLLGLGREGGDEGESLAGQNLRKNKAPIKSRLSGLVRKPVNGENSSDCQVLSS